MPLREYHKRWEFDLKSSPERLWPFIADTNRFNRDTGVPQIDVDPPTNDCATPAAKYDSRSTVCLSNGKNNHSNGSSLSRFGVERVYSKGPLARLKMRAELTPNSDGGTHLIYELWSTPRNLPGAVAIPMQTEFRRRAQVS